MINGKFDRKAIMQEAWRMARQTVINLGVGTAKEFFSSCLKKVWEMANVSWDLETEALFDNQTAVKVKAVKC